MINLTPKVVIVIFILAAFLSGCGGGGHGGNGDTKSSNADLSALTVSSGTLVPAFDAAITSYTVSVANNVEEVTVTGKKADANASVSAPVTLSSLAVGVAQTAAIKVTAQNGATKTYMVAVTRVGTSTKTIIGFSFTNPVATGTIDENNHIIAVTLPYGTNVTALAPTINHTGASINPASGEVKNFSNKVTYTVTAQDGSYQEYTVTLIVKSGFTLIYVGNNNTGGSVPVSAEYNPSDMVTVSANTGNLIRTPVAGTAEAFKFGGWNTKANGSGITYAAGSGTFTINQDTTLYAKWVKFELRDTGPAGGLIFYDKGSFSGGWRYLEAAPYDYGNMEAFGYYNSGGTYTAVGTSIEIGEGKNNTTKLATYLSTWGAAKCCANFSITYQGLTYNDWFLPSSRELETMYYILYKDYNYGNFVAADMYWSSSELGDYGTRAITWAFQYGEAANWTNSGAFRLRFARQF